MRRLLIDTSVIIDFFRRKDKKLTLYYALTKENLYISILTHTELYSGVSVWENIQAQNELETLLAQVNIVALTTDLSQMAGKIKSVHKIDLIDAIIAATAIVQDLELVTINIKHFEEIKGIKIYKPKA